MNIALIGSGGRESALAWAVSKSQKCNNLYILPGNGGTSKYGKNMSVDIHYPFRGLIEFCRTAEIDLVIVGPEQPLVEGAADALKKNQIPVFGPSQNAARLEGSKAFMKEFLYKYGIPTANFKVFSDAQAAMDYVRKENRPFVIKTDGLAAGKGAIVNKNVEDTIAAIRRVMVNKEFGAAGDMVIVEEILEGIEVSVFIVTDGKDFKYMASAQDHKRIFDNDEGSNTGGMGAYAPVPFVSDGLKNIIIENIVKPTLHGMQTEGSPYTGILYLGLMITKSGPSVIEYNIRLGDPEAQAVLPLIKTDFLDIVLAVLDNKLGELKFEYNEGYCTGVVMASQGYPGNYRRNLEITGSLKDEQGIYVFHAGTKIRLDGILITDGGRVLCVSALGKTLKESIDRAYAKTGRINFEGAHYRKDIGKKGLNL